MADSPQVIEHKNKIKVTYNELAPSLQAILDNKLDSSVAEGTAALIDYLYNLDPELRLFVQNVIPTSNLEANRTMWLDTSNKLYNAYGSGNWIRQRLIYF